MKKYIAYFLVIAPLFLFAQAVTIDANASITIGNTATLEVSGDITNNGELIVEASSTVGSGSLIAKAASNPQITFRRTLTDSEWTLIGVPLTGETIADVDDNLLTQNGKSAIGIFSNSDNDYVNYDTGDTSVLTAGKGYQIARSGTGSVDFVGNMVNADHTAAVTAESGTNGNWNLIGNPYPSYLNLTEDSGDATNNFMTVNESIIASDSDAIYAWDGSAWDIYNQTTNDVNFIAPGDGFFIYVGSSGNVSFTEDMQSSGQGQGFTGNVVNSDDIGDSDIKTSSPNGGNYTSSSKKSSSLLEFSVTDDTQSSSWTRLYFDYDMTKGLDRGYDARAMLLSPNKIFTKLLEDHQNVRFGIQALPYDGINNFVIPLGIITESSALTLEITKNTLDNDFKIYLEDKLLNVFKEIKDKIDLKFVVNGDGSDRFNLHFTDELIPEFATDSNLRIYKVSENEIKIMGDPAKNYSAEIYDFSGRLINQVDFQHKINVSDLKKGIKILKIKSDDSVDVIKKFKLN